jgi:hypothetical protein
MYKLKNIVEYGQPGRMKLPEEGYGQVLGTILGAVTGAFQVVATTYGTSRQIKLQREQWRSQRAQIADDRRRQEEEYRRQIEQWQNRTQAVDTGAQENEGMPAAKPTGTIAQTTIGGIPSNYLLYAAVGGGGLVLLAIILKKRKQ